MTGLPLSAHFDGFRDAREPGKPLRARRAGNDAELYFGLADLRARNGDAIVAGHGEFQAAAESGSVDGDDHWLRAVFDFQQKRQQALRREVCRKSFCRIP